MASQQGSPHPPEEPASPKPQPLSTDFPQLISIAPAIFLPITQDFTKPIAPIPSATTARLRGAIDRRHTAHAKAVSGNIMDYYSREAVRQSQLPQAALPSNATQHRGLSEQDRNRLATNLESPHEPGRDYNIGIEAIPATNLEQLPSQDLRLLGQAVRDLASYQDHAGVKGQRLREEHKRAQEREAA